MEYDATTTRIFNVPPYTFFSVIGVVFASSCFILLLLKYNFNIQRYTKIFFYCIPGLLIGAKFFGFLTGLFNAIANKEAITLQTFINTGIVFYGGLIGFLSSFLIICKIWNKVIEYRVVDLTVVCIPLFHFFGRLGCFFAGCCYGVENHSVLSIHYTNRIKDEIVSVSRLPIQLIESVINIFLFIVLLIFLNIEKSKERLLIIYLFIYSIMRIVLEVFRGDVTRGIWNRISFSQFISMIIIISMILIIRSLSKREKKHAIY